MQADKQANELAITVDRIGNITNFTENCASKNFFFSQDSKETRFLIFVYHKKCVLGKYPIHENNMYVYFH